MGVAKRVGYTHLDMIDCIIQNPAITQNELAIRYGYTPSWISNVMASDAWKSMFAARREKLVDPVITQTLNERMEALAIRSHEKLMGMLDKPDCPAPVALKALELGAKSLGLGQQPPAAPPVVDLNALAHRLLELNPKGNVYEGEASEVPADAQG